MINKIFKLLSVWAAFDPSPTSLRLLLYVHRSRRASAFPSPRKRPDSQRLMDVGKSLTSSARFWSRTTGWFPGAENVSLVICSVEQSVQRCGILPFRQYWLKDKWSEEPIRRIGGGVKTVKISSLIIMPHAALPTASASHADLRVKQNVKQRGVGRSMFF